MKYFKLKKKNGTWPLNPFLIELNGIFLAKIKFSAET